MQMKVIFSETLRSFYHNIYINLLLMLQFIICFFLLITMLTFYIEIGNNDSVAQIEKIDNKEWYTVRLNMNRSMSNINDIALEADGFTRVRSFYREVSNGSMYQLISFRDGQCVYLDSELMDEKFGKDNYHSLIDSDGVSSESACYNKLCDEGKELTGVRMRAVQMNLKAYQLFSLKLSEGEGLTSSNTKLTDKNSYMPVVLGYHYKGKFKVGDTFRLHLPVMVTDHWAYNVKVVGILEEKSWVPAYGDGNRIIDLDDYIICPVGMDIRYVPDTADERAKLTSGQYSDALFYSFISLNPGTDYSDVILKSNELSEKYDVYHLLFTSTSFGMDVLKNETKTQITMITVLAFMLLCFTMFCLISASVSKMQKNLRTYAVYLVNGSGLGNIIMPYLLEMLILLLPSVSINYFLLRKKMYLSGNYTPFWTVVLMAISVFIGMSIFLFVKLRGIETEELMRRKE